MRFEPGATFTERILCLSKVLLETAIILTQLSAWYFWPYPETCNYAYIATISYKHVLLKLSTEIPQLFLRQSTELLIKHFFIKNYVHNNGWNSRFHISLILFLKVEPFKTFITSRRVMLVNDMV